MRVVEATWFSTFRGTVGIVVTDDEFGGRKARIGICTSTNEKVDTQFIVDHGQEIPVSYLEALLRTLKRKEEHARKD
jgi:hypothetical protein